MRNKTEVLLGTFKRGRRLALAFIATTVLAAVAFSSLATQPTQAATNGNLNFQARLMTNTGGIVPDGFYNLQFKLYDAVSGGSNVWTETYYDEDGSGGTSVDDYRVRVKNGYLTVNLGSRSAFGSINWDQNLWITMNVGGTTITATPTWNGEMSPRLKLTGVPYAFRAGTLATGNGTYQSTLSLIQPTVGNQVFQILDRAAAGTYNILTNDYVSNAAAGTTAIQFQGQGSATAPVLALKGGASPGAGADLLKLKNSSDEALAGFTSSGELYLGRAGASGATGSLKIYNAANSNYIGITAGTTGASYTLTLPTAVGANGDCLKTSNGTGTLTFGTCATGSGATTYAYDTGTDADGGDITGTTLTMYKASGTTPGLLSADGQTIGGAKTFTADTTITRDSATAFRVQNAGGTISVMNVDTTTQTLALRSLADAATLSGTELMTGAFNAATNWGSISGTGAAATATHSAGSTTAITTATPASVTIGKTYQVTFTTSGVTAGSGTVTASLGGLTGKAIDTNKSGEVQVFSSVTGTTGLAFTPTSGFIGTVTGVSVKEITNQAPTLVLSDSSNATTIELRSGTAAARNIGMGIQSLQSNTTGTLNIGIGTAALKRNTTGTGNTAIGDISMQNNTTGGTNTGVGASSLRDNTTGSQNTAVGATALMVNTIGGNNTALGGGSLLANTSGSDNTSVGYASQQVNTTGVGNSSIGVQALSANTTGSYNTAIGAYASYQDSDGFVPGVALSNSTAVGYRAQVQASNSLVLGGAGNNGVNVGVGTSLPDNILSVSPYQLAATNSGVITASQSTTTVTASSGIFTAAMVGSKITWLSGANAGATATISGYTSTTVVTVSGSATVASGTFRIGATASQATTTVTAASSVFTAAMVGSKIIWVDGSSATITAYSSGTSVTVTPSQSVSSNEFRVHYAGLQVTSAGKVGVGTTAPTANFQVSTPVNTTTAFQIQNSAGNSVLNVDTTTNTLSLRSAGDTATVSGTDLFVNSELDTGVANWGTPSGTGTAATASHTNGSATAITAMTPDVTVVASTWYRVAFKVTNYLSGSITPSIGNTTGKTISANTSTSPNAEEVQVLLASNTNDLTFTPSSDFVGTITGISVNAITVYSSSLTLTKSDGSTVALEVRTGSTDSLAIGNQALQSNTSGTGNTAFGSYTLRRNTIGSNNTALGSVALVANTTGASNTAVGSGAMNANTTGGSNTAIGVNALQVNTIGSYNVAIGVSSLIANTVGFNNIALGGSSLAANTSGWDNSAVGRFALTANTTGSQNSAQGNNALSNSTTGNYNAAFGNASLGRNTTGSNNTAVGYYAGNVDTDGFTNGQTTNNTTLIGNKAITHASNTAIIGGAGSDAVNVGIGTSLPDNTLSVSPYQYTSTSSVTDSGATTASMSGTTTVTANSSIFTAGMVGSKIRWDSGSTAIISAYTSGTVVTATVSQTIASGQFDVVNAAYQGTTIASGGSSNTTVTSSSSVFTSAMVGSKIVWANGSTATITAYSSGTSVTVTPSQAVAADIFRVHYVGFQVTNAGKVGVGTTQPAANFQVSTTVNTATALQVMNATGNEVLTVDTSNGQLALGKASTVQGKLVFYGTAGANTVSLLGPSSNPASSFTLTLPSTIAGNDECLKSGTVSAGNVPLVFGSCGTTGGLVKVPAATADNTVTPTANGVVALTVNATSGTTAVGAIINQALTGDALQVNSTGTTGTQTNGIYFNRNGSGGTTTNGVNVTNTLGTMTNGITVAQSGGTLGNGLNFSGTMTNLINSGSFIVNGSGAISGATGLTMASGNFSQIGTGTFSTGTGAISLRGDTTLSSGKSLIFANTGGANTVSIVASGTNPTSSFSLTLPSALGSSGNCLKDTTGSGVLGFGTCGAGGSSTLQDAYDTSGNVTASQHILLNSTYGGFKIRDAGTPVTGSMFLLQNTSGTSAMGFSIISSVGHLRVYNLSDSTKYNDMYFDHANNAAVYGATSGSATYVGNGTGNIALQLTDEADALNATKTDGALSGANSVNSFSFTETITASTTAKSGAVMKVESLSTGSNISGHLLHMNQQSTTTGNLIHVTTGGSTEAFKVSYAGSVTVGAGQTVSSASGALALTAGSGNLTLTAGGANKVIVKPGTNSTSSFEVQNASNVAILTVNTTDSRLQIGAADANTTMLVLDSSSVAIVSEPTGVNGAMYYNTAVNKFRCRENGAWANCVSAGKQQFILQDSFATATAAATNLAASTLNCVGDPSLRTMANMAGYSKLRIMGRIGGTTATATTIRLQYHTGGNPAVATGDGGWTTLATTAGTHTAATYFYDPEIAIPSGAQVDGLVVRACIFGGNGTADPTLNGVRFNVYN